MSVLLSNGSLVHYNGEVPAIGSTVSVILKNPDGSMEAVRAEVLYVWGNE